MKIESYIANDGKTICIRASDDNYVYERAEVGVDGDCGYALLGPNIQEGECEFVRIPDDSEELPGFNAERWACGLALHRLRARLGGNISYFIKP